MTRPVRVTASADTLPFLCQLDIVMIIAFQFLETKILSLYLEQSVCFL